MYFFLFIQSYYSKIIMNTKHFSIEYMQKNPDSTLSMGDVLLCFICNDPF